MSAVQRFYNGKNIFITGGTGFLGKVLVEKLLRSCPGVGSIYCLMRNKKGATAEERFQTFTNNIVFEKLQREDPGRLDKIRLITGDILTQDLGISDADRRLLADEVNVVFHSAATISFNEKLLLAYQMNTLGTRKVIQLCKEMKHLQALVHVSTSYSNCDIKDIKEVVYKSKMDPDDLGKMPEEALKNEKKIIGGHPNTYTFTKCLAENITMKEAHGLPAVIVRPSIVTSSLAEPFPGWIDSYGGPTGFYMTVMMGLARTLMTRRECVSDIIPVDLVVNTLLVAAADLEKGSSGDPKVVHCASGSSNPITWGQLHDDFVYWARKEPLKSVVFYPGCKQRTNYLINYAVGFFLQYLPALAIDACMKLAGKKPFAVRVAESIRLTENTSGYFAQRQWNFHDNNMRRLFATLSVADKKIFNIDPRTIQWDQYMRSYYEGVKRHMFKDDSSSQQYANRKVQSLYWAGVALKSVVLLTATAMVLSHLELASTSQEIMRNMNLYAMNEEPSRR